jgi:hypothetical protein
MRWAMCESGTDCSCVSRGADPVSLRRGVRAGLGLGMATGRSRLGSARSTYAKNRSPVSGSRRGGICDSASRPGDKSRLFLDLFRMVGQPGLARACRHSRADLSRAGDGTCGRREGHDHVHDPRLDRTAIVRSDPDSGRQRAVFLRRSSAHGRHEVQQVRRRERDAIREEFGRKHAAADGRVRLHDRSCAGF